MERRPLLLDAMLVLQYRLPPKQSIGMRADPMYYNPIAPPADEADQYLAGTRLAQVLYGQAGRTNDPARKNELLKQANAIAMQSSEAMEKHRDKKDWHGSLLRPPSALREAKFGTEKAYTPGSMLFRQTKEESKSRLTEALEKQQRTQSKPYTFPSVSKGVSSDQAFKQMMGSYKRGPHAVLASHAATSKKRKEKEAQSDFSQIQLPACDDALSDAETVDYDDHKRVGDQVLDEEGRRIVWGWEPQGSLLHEMPPLPAHRRARRVPDCWDDIIELGLDHASADRNRGRKTTGVRAWFAHAAREGFSPHRPMDPLTPIAEKLEDEWLMMRFIAALVEEKGVAPRTAANYFSQTQGWHAREHGVKLCGGLKLERLPQMIKGLRRVIGDAPKKVRRGVAPQALKKAMDLLLDPNNKEHANIRAALAVALQGLLRSCEYTSKSRKIDRYTLLRSDIKYLHENKLVLMMCPGKNMRHLGNKTCPLVIAGGELVDAVAEIKNLLRVDPAPADAPLFRHPATNTPLTHKLMNETIKQCMHAVGEPPAEFSTHSLRIGGATALFAAGANETVIRTMGRWSSDIHRLYVRACFEQCCEWSSKAGSAQVSDMAGMDFDPAEVDDY